MFFIIICYFLILFFLFCFLSSFSVSYFFFFFFSSRSRHTSGALVTEFRRVLFRSWMNSAQHMLPDQNHARAQIDASRGALALARVRRPSDVLNEPRPLMIPHPAPETGPILGKLSLEALPLHEPILVFTRSEARRVGTEGVRTGRSGGSP